MHAEHLDPSNYDDEDWAKGAIHIAVLPLPEHNLYNAVIHFLDDAGEVVARDTPKIECATENCDDVASQYRNKEKS